MEDDIYFELVGLIVQKMEITLSEEARTALAGRFKESTNEIVAMDAAGRGFGGAAAPVPIPQSWEEAKAQVPGLMKWSVAKAAADKDGRELTIVEHLRDQVHGYGHWTLRKPGLPRTMLNKWEDKAAYRAIYVHLRIHKELPQDLYIPTIIEQHRVAHIDPEEVRAAYRLIRQAEKQAKGRS
jgi:hypothetical protein